MLLLRTEKLAEGDDWLYELKLNGFRAVAFKSRGKVFILSRNDKDFNSRFPSVVKALAALPDETIIDGEIVALDGDGKPSFNALQNYGSSKTPLLYYVFDIMMLSGKNVMSEPLARRRELLETKILSTLAEPVRYSPELKARLSDLIDSVQQQGFEGLVAKRRDSAYEPGLRSGAWAKMRVNQGQEFVIGGYTVGGRTFDALIFGYYEGGDLMYVARTRNGFTPRSRENLLSRMRKLEVKTCPFRNLPEPRGGAGGKDRPRRR